MTTNHPLGVRGIEAQPSLNSLEPLLAWNAFLFPLPGRWEAVASGRRKGSNAK